MIDKDQLTMNHGSRWTNSMLPSDFVMKYENFEQVLRYKNTCAQTVRSSGAFMRKKIKIKSADAISTVTKVEPYTITVTLLANTDKIQPGMIATKTGEISGALIPTELKDMMGQIVSLYK